MCGVHFFFLSVLVYTSNEIYLHIETLHKYLDTSLKYYTYLLCEEKEENKKKELQENIKFYNNSYGETDNKSFYGMLIMHLRCLLKDNNFIDKLDDKNIL